MSDQKPCPRCGSENISYTPSGCLCSDRHSNPCWSYPTCDRCGYTNNSAGANSEGTYWGSFTSYPVKSHQITSEVQKVIDLYDSQKDEQV